MDADLFTHICVNKYLHKQIGAYTSVQKHAHAYMYTEIYISRQNEPAYEETHEHTQIHKDTNTNSYVHTQMHVHTCLRICTLMVCSQTHI